MPEKSRRAFLAAAGVTALAGCSSITGSSPNNNTTSTGGTPTTADTTTTGTTETGTGTSTQTTTRTTTQQGQKKPSNQGTQFESFQNFKRWSKLGQSGPIGATTKDTYQDSKQAARMVAKKDDDFVGMTKSAGRGGWDFSGKNVSVAVKVKNPLLSKLQLQLYAPDRGHTVSMTRTLTGPTDRWMRVDFGVTSETGDANLGKVQEIQLVGRPDDQSKPAEFLVDDIRTVKAPKKGTVTLVFDDTHVTHYTKALPLMKKYGFPGVENIIADAVYNEGRLDVGQMREMQDAGWEMAVHGGGGTFMNEYSKKKQLRKMKKGKEFLRRNGFYRGMKNFVVPKNVMGPHTYSLANEHFETAYRFGFCPNGVPTTDFHNFGFANGYAIDASRRVVDYAAKYKQNAVLLFPEIGGDLISAKEFENTLKHIKKKNVDVVTPTRLKKQQGYLKEDSGK